VTLVKQLEAMIVAAMRAREKAQEPFNKEIAELSEKLAVARLAALGLERGDMVEWTTTHGFNNEPRTYRGIVTGADWYGRPTGYRVKVDGSPSKLELGIYDRQMESLRKVTQ
jgi:hypothetical protein